MSTDPLAIAVPGRTRRGRRRIAPTRSNLLRAGVRLPRGPVGPESRDTPIRNAPNSTKVTILSSNPPDEPRAAALAGSERVTVLVAQGLTTCSKASSHGYRAVHRKKVQQEMRTGARIAITVSSRGAKGARWVSERVSAEPCAVRAPRARLCLWSGSRRFAERGELFSVVMGGKSSTSTTHGAHSCPRSRGGDVARSAAVNSTALERSGRFILQLPAILEIRRRAATSAPARTGRAPARQPSRTMRYSRLE